MSSGSLSGSGWSINRYRGYFVRRNAICAILGAMPRNCALGMRHGLRKVVPARPCVWQPIN
jgi:hypothetical protein